jgi:ComF family protein
LPGNSLSYALYQSLWVGLDLIFPPICGGCGKSGSRWCLECHSKVILLTAPLCSKCGSPVQKESQQCTRCVKENYSFEALRSWAVFDDPLKSALHRLKYKHDASLGDSLASYLSSFVSGLNWKIDAVVPVPLGKARKKERGYNQVAMIAYPLSMKLGLQYVPQALARSRETRTQVGLSAVERKENVKDAFRATPSLVKGCVVLLMDDVATTGSTLSSGADALLSAGACQIYALTVARALPHHGLQHA